MLPYFASNINSPKAPKSVNWELDLITSSSCYRQGERSLFNPQRKSEGSLGIKNKLMWSKRPVGCHPFPLGEKLLQAGGMVGLKTEKKEKLGSDVELHLRARGLIFTWAKPAGGN